MTDHVGVIYQASQLGYPCFALCKMGTFQGGSCYIRLSATSLTISGQQGTEVAEWPYSAIRHFNCSEYTFVFTSGRKGPFGVENYDFQFEASVFEAFKSSLSKATGAKFEPSAPISVTTVSPSKAHTYSRQCSLSDVPTHPVPGNNMYYIPDSTMVSADLKLTRLSSTSSCSSSCSFSSSLSSSSEDHPAPTPTRQLLTSLRKQVVHKYEEVDVPAGGNSPSSSPSTSPFTYATSQCLVGDLHATGGPKSSLTQLPSCEGAMLPSTPPFTWAPPTHPLMANATAHSLSEVPGDRTKRPNIYENVNPHLHYDFVPLRKAACLEPEQRQEAGGGLGVDCGGCRQLSFTTGSGEEVLYDVPRPQLGGAPPHPTPLDQNAHHSLYENVFRGSYENVQGCWTSQTTAEGQPNGLFTSPPPSCSLSQQRVNVASVQSTLTLGNGMQRSNGGSVVMGRAALCSPTARTAASSGANTSGCAFKEPADTSNDNYVVMHPVEHPASLDDHVGTRGAASDGEVVSNMWPEPGQRAGPVEEEVEGEKEGYVVMKRMPTFSGFVVSVQGHQRT